MVFFLVYSAGSERFKTLYANYFHQNIWFLGSSELRIKVLSIFGLESMDRRLTVIDLCWCFKIVHGVCEESAKFRFTTVSSLLLLAILLKGKGLNYRGVLQRVKVFFPRSVLELFLCGTLPAEVVEVSSLEVFKSLLRKLHFGYR